MGASIADAVGRLDPTDDGHWTTDGLPRCDVVAKIAGRDVARREITDAAPQATRAAALAARSMSEVQVESPTATAPSASAAIADFIGANADAVRQVLGADAGPPAPEASGAGGPADPLADDRDAGAVAPRADGVLEMPVARIFASLELVDRAILEADRRATILARRRDRVAAALDGLGRITAQLEAAKARLQGPQRQDPGIKAYLERQRQTRAARAARAQKFVEVGVTPADVVSALDPRCKLDQVMARRRPGMGGTRPAYPQAEGA